jgi:predicted Na+-dependent transporter
MDSDILLLSFIAASVLLISMLKTHIAFTILALCTGYVLSDIAGPSVVDFLDGSISQSEFPIYETVRLILLFLPLVLIGFRFRKTQRGVGRFIQQLLPALALTMLATVFIVDILPLSSTENIARDSYLAGSIEDFSPLLVLFAVSTALFDVLIKHADDSLRKKRGPGRPKKH